MKPWERNVLEYRPTLGFTTNIQSVVEAATGRTDYKPTTAAIQLAQLLGSDLLDNAMATASRASDMLDKLKRCMSSDPTYAAYREAKDAGDDPAARDLHLSNMQSITGNPQIDAIPLLEQTKDEVEAFIDYLNRELFDGEADYSNMEATREIEELSINNVFLRESMGKAINYEKLMSRTRMITAGLERLETYKDTVDLSETYLLSATKDAVADDVEGLIYYLSTVETSHLPLMQQTLEMGFKRPATQAAGIIVNMDRAGDREFRDMLDDRLSAVRKTFHDTSEPLRPYYGDDTIDSTGGDLLRSLLLSGINAVANSFEQLTVDHMANSMMNRDQTRNLFAYLQAKKNTQLIHKLIGTFADEFDPIDLDKEVKRFIKQQGLANSGTLCG